MVFDSIEFLVLFAVVFVLYFTLPVRLRNPLLLVSSAVFYMWWRPLYIVFILFSVTVDYFVARVLDHRDEPGTRRLLLAASLSSNLGLLFFFKYFDFVARSLAAAVGLAGHPWEPPILNLVLPVGISFHTFQALSYTLDVYRREIPVERSLPKLWLYVLFFPQLVAGPIERAKNMLPQFDEIHYPDEIRIASGLRLMLWGLAKKMVIADRLAVLADAVYTSPQAFSGWPLVAATVAFAVQIYADFSGYSDIAIGAARVLGFRLQTNFNRPYFATSPVEFWRRWHISLSMWFRDYVYIPLGGGRGRGWAVALIATFLLSGLWHGAKWTFVVWGLYHGLVVLLWRGLDRTRFARWPAAVRMVLTFVLMCAGWILFRANTLSDASYIVAHLASATRRLPMSELGIHRPDLAIAAAGALALLLVDTARERSWSWTLPERWPLPVRWTACIGVALAIIHLAGGLEIPFIYFQF
jgi:D-alanyl-lipoteichoic acid acyltransferase DltB (MBOAT superfamily)